MLPSSYPPKKAATDMVAAFFYYIPGIIYLTISLYRLNNVYTLTFYHQLNVSFVAL